MRTSKGSARRRSIKRLLNEAKGNRGGRSKLLRTVKETLVRARAFAYRGRRLKKRDFRRLWITRLTAACRAHGLSYSEFIHGLAVAGLELNRKTLSELAIHHPEVFGEIVELARSSAASAA